MSSPDTDMLDEAAHLEPEAAGPAKRRRLRWGRWSLGALAGLLVLVSGVLIAGRLALRTGPGRAAVARLLEGLPLGPVGRLHIEGLGGDPLGDLTLRRLQIVDAKGPWLDAEDTELRWSAAALLHRRFHAQSLTARSLSILRSPLLKVQPPTSAGPARLPIAVQIDAVRLLLATRPAFSVKPGLWDVDGGFVLERNLASKGRIAARSRLHAGDGLSAVFQVGEGGRIQVRADAVEGQGGALAGSLGLPVDRRVALAVRASGTSEAGSLTLRATTGADVPLVADAVWSGGVSHLKAGLELTASRLTRDLAARAGPRADLTLVARHLSGDAFDVQGLLTAQTAKLKVSGPLDWKAQTTPGLVLALSVADASRWAQGLALGPVELDGRAKGDVATFDFGGRIDAQRFSQSGYALARLGGPVTLSRRKDQWRLQTDLAGAGGAGKGVLASLLGAAPRASLDATRLADGRLLISRLDAAGARLTVSGQGGQGLFGGLSFKGSATLSDLGALKPGARGRLQAGWTAEEPKGAKDWRFGVDARGAGVLLGLGAADHFVGPAPHLRADASYGPAGVQVAGATLDGAAAQLTARGRLDPKGVMAFDLGWRAQGPFDAGPLQVAGQATGTGRIAGTLSAPRLDLQAQVASLALGRLILAPARLSVSLGVSGSTVAGTAALDGPSAYGAANAKAAFRFADGGVDVEDLAADAGGLKASGRLSLRGGRPLTADLALQLRPGAFIDHGNAQGSLRLEQGGAGLTAHLALDGKEIAAPGLPGVLHSVSLHADGPFDRLPFQLSADSGAPQAWRFTGGGRLEQAGEARTLSLSGSGAVRGIGFKTLAPATVSLQGDTRKLALSLAVGGGRADVAARQAGDTLTASAKLIHVDLATMDADYDGALDATLALNGHGASLAGTLDAGLSNARSRDAPADLALNGHVRADLANERLRLVASATNAQGLKSNASLDLPAVATAAPFRIAIDRTRPMHGDFAADGELRPLWDLLIGGDQRLSGHVATQGALAGSLNAPHVTGRATVSSGRYQNFAAGLDLQAFAVRADFDQQAVRIDQLSGTDGHKGVMSGSGDISLVKGGGSTFALKLSKFQAVDNDLAKIVMSGAATVTRDASGHAKLVGALTVDRADIVPSTPATSGVVTMDVVEINKPGEAGAREAAAPHSVAPPVALDVAIRAPRGIFVKGKGLNLELSLDAHVGGTLSAPDLSGKANVVLGSYDFAGKRFDFDTRSNVSLAASPDQIRLDLTATRDDTTLTAVVHVSGTAARPEIKLSSTPVLPQDEVLSQVLFGSSASQLTGAQAAELASTLASLSGGGGFDVLGRLRQIAGLDRLAFGQGESGTGVSGGKYVGDNVYIELTGGGREGPSASVEWRVKKNFAIISRVGTQGDTQLSIQYRRNFR